MKKTKEQKYLLTMMIAKRLRADGIITDEEYCQIDTKFKAQYSPKISTLFTDITLNNPAKYANM